jgi:hypothetical protein
VERTSGSLLCALVDKAATSHRTTTGRPSANLKWQTLHIQESALR